VVVVSPLYAVDIYNVSDTNAILLSTIFICDIIYLLDIVGLGVLNGL
jgi:hypothetical protein